jgi:quercetin dioxygenase-like cupin family protein
MGRNLSAQAARDTTVPPGGRRSRVAFQHELPQMDGSRLKVSVVEVVYAPGAASTPHSHPCPVIGYIAQGAVRMHFKGDTAAVFKAGESFYEAPNGVHLVSANASPTEPAKLIAYFVCDNDKPLSSPVP